eukprot:scaffold75760_cov60-Cyclotella_meneghiniana.AAC.13
MMETLRGLGQDQRLKRTRNEIDRMGSELRTSHECFICSKLVTISENALAGGNVYHSECVTTSECPICMQEMGNETPKILSCGYLFSSGLY